MLGLCGEESGVEGHSRGGFGGGELGDGHKSRGGLSCGHGAGDMLMVW